jgi:hypothetical protein
MSEEAAYRGCSDVDRDVAVAMREPIIAAVHASLVSLPLMFASEMLGLAGHLLEEQAKLLSSLSACRTPAHVVAAQSDFHKGAWRACRAHASKLVHHAREAGRELDCA